MDVTFGQLRALLAIAEHGSFTGAAPALGLTQSAVSRTVAALERQLGGVLVVRRRDGASLTPFGREVAGHASGALDHLRAMEELSRREAVSGLRVGTIGSAAVRLVPAAVTALRAEWPAAEVLVVRGEDDELAAWLRDDTIDLAVTSAPVSGAQAEFADEFLAVLPGNHPLTHAGAVPLAALVAAGVADPGGTCGPRLAEGFAAHGVDWAPAHVVRDPETVLAMAAAGITAGVVPSASVGTPPRGAVLLPLDPPLRRTLYVRHAPGHRLAARLTELLAAPELVRRG
ncbi:LysR family transcriptional regulator [Prauserella endophytica]|uniref:LysR family transcriptional regulator n=1 Tax=Prauserella endophytica TaxID=1592324 RepID=A0ABY2S8J4_9PSEU|nr:LysR family transcriptional regulator [Prauserella endophytica]